MKFPGYRDYRKTITINKDEWQIKFCSKIPERHHGKEVILGLCADDEYIIFLKYGQTRFELFCTFIHELIHAIEHSYNFTIDRRPEHPRVYDLAEAIGQIFKDNF